MSENSNNKEKEKINSEEIKSEKTEDIESDKSEEKKSKFTFKCTRCNKCCESRGPIPLTLWDLELWARNGVLLNFMPYMELYKNPAGSLDLILKPIPVKKDNADQKTITQDPFSSTPIDELLEEKCPLYNLEKKECLIYDNRPLSCRTYPLEFDGKNFTVVDVDCPGVGQEGMTKKELEEMKETAKLMFAELTRFRISIPILHQIIQKDVMMDLIKQNKEAMESMSEEDRKKIDEIFSKSRASSEK
jgi:Fe-S-cluster containining protein